MDDLAAVNPTYEHSGNVEQTHNDTTTATQTAESKNEPTSSSSSSYWGWSSLVSTIKKQTDTVVDVYKRDISEFVSTVGAESSAGLGSISKSIQSNVRSLASLALEEDDDDGYKTNDDNGDRNVNGYDNTVLQDNEMPPDEIDPQSVVQKKDDKWVKFDNSEEDIVIEISLPDAADFTETAAQIQEKASQYKDTASDLFGKFTTGITTIIKSNIQVTPGHKKHTKANNSKIIFDRRTAAIASLRLDPATYLFDPCKSEDAAIVERYTKFYESFQVADYSAKIAKITSEDPNLETVLEKIVPDQASQNDCWCRYFFKIAEMDLVAENRRQLIKDVVDDGGGEDDFNWDTSDDEEDSTDDRQASGNEFTQEPKDEKDGKLIVEESVDKPNNDAATLDSTKAVDQHLTPPAVAELIRQGSEEYEVVNKTPSLDEPREEAAVPQSESVTGKNVPQEEKKEAEEEESDDWGDWD